jgi:hypothetical protein
VQSYFGSITERGANEFQEYACGYYGIQSEQVSNDMTLISKENKQYKIDVDKEEAEFRSRSIFLKNKIVRECE